VARKASTEPAAPKKRREPPAEATVPEPIARPEPGDYLALISRAIFQAGLSWAIIESKWPAYLELFEGFDPRIVAAFDETDVDRLLADGRIVRTRKKILGTVANARALLELESAEGGFAAYLRSFESYPALETALRERFAFLGRLSVYYLLFLTQHPVPRFEAWETTIDGDHPRMRAMVARGRALGRSSELP